MGDFILDSKTYCLSTRGSDATVLNTNTNYKSFVKFDLPDFLVPDDSIAYAQVSVPYVVIPVSFFQINEYNNMLEVTENAVTTKYFWEFGNYNAKEFMDDFRTILPNRFGISLDIVNSKFIITNTTYEYTFTSNSSIDFVMGFSDTISSTSRVITMPRVYNFLPLPRVFLHCPELGNGHNGTNGDILLSIPNNSRLNSQIVYTAPDIKTLVKEDQISSLTFKITDDEGNLLNFNGVASFFTIQLDIYRKWIPRIETFDTLVKNANLNTIKRELDELQS